MITRRQFAYNTSGEAMPNNAYHLELPLLKPVLISGAGQSLMRITQDGALRWGLTAAIEYKQTHEPLFEIHDMDFISSRKVTPVLPRKIKKD